jgi:hypothetical protein
MLNDCLFVVGGGGERVVVAMCGGADAVLVEVASNVYARSSDSEVRGLEGRV